MTDQGNIQILRIKIGLAVAIIKACPSGVTPKEFASQICIKHYFDIANSKQKERLFREENTHLRQKLLESNMRMGEMLLLKNRGSHKRKGEMPENLTSKVPAIDLHERELSKVETENPDKSIDSRASSHNTEPTLAFNFLKAFLYLRENISEFNLWTGPVNEEKVLISIQSINFLIEELFQISDNPKQNTTCLYSMMTTSFNKITDIIGGVIEIISYKAPSFLAAKSAFANLLERVIAKMNLFLWNHINDRTTNQIYETWRDILDRLISISKCSNIMKCCLSKALIEVIYIATCQVKHRGTGRMDVSASEVFFNPFLMENSAKLFLCLEEILSSIPRLNCSNHSDVVNRMREESKRLLNYSLLHVVETFPLFAIRVWEIAVPLQSQ